MTKEEHIGYWVESAEKDLAVAQNLFDSSNYDWCLFIGHLVIEKALKANFVKVNDNRIPPKIHDLIRLADISGIQLDDDKKRFFFLLNKFNLEARYPEYKNEMFRIATKEFTAGKFQEIIEVFQWLRSLI